MLLYDGLWMWALCWDCTSVYFNLQWSQYIMHVSNWIEAHKRVTWGPSNQYSMYHLIIIFNGPMSNLGTFACKNEKWKGWLAIAKLCIATGFDVCQRIFKPICTGMGTFILDFWKKKGTFLPHKTIWFRQKHTFLQKYPNFIPLRSGSNASLTKQNQS